MFIQPITRPRTFFLVLAFLMTLFVLFYSLSANARDNGQYVNVNPEIKEWVKGLKNKKNENCCDTADGFPAEGYDWDTKNGKYRVFVKGKWLDVPEYTVLDGPNKLGVPMVWYWTFIDYDGKEHIMIRCFLPGAGG